MSLSCALWATSLHQWARRYIRVTQPARCSPEKRARMRAFFANGVEKMHISWAVEGLPTLLHLSLFFFFGGLIIFLFNVDREVFLWVVSWIGLFSMVYGFITLLPLIRQDSPYYSPLSVPAWFLYAGIQYVTFTILASIADRCGWYAWDRFVTLMYVYRGWMLGGVEKKAEELAEEQSSKIDVGILDWTISALGDDHSLEKFIEAVPGFFNSKLVKDERLPYELSISFYQALKGFLGRTLSSNSVIDKVKLHRLHISLTAINLNRFFGVSEILQYIFRNHWDQLPESVEICHTLAPWCTSNHQETARYARMIVAKVLATVRERDDHWVELAARVYGLPEREIRDILTHDHDNGSLALLIHLTRRSFRSNLDWRVLGVFSQIDIRNTLLGLQDDFCTLWNEIVQEARNQRPLSTPVCILREIRHQYLALHQGSDAVPTAFSSTDYHNYILLYPSSYPLCDIASHRRDHVPVPVPTQPIHSPDTLPHHSISGGDAISRHFNEAAIIARPSSSSHLTKPSEIGDSSRDPAATSPTLLVHAGPRPTDASPSSVAVLLQDIPLANTLSHPLEGTTQWDKVAPCTEPDITQILSAASLPAPTPTLAPVPASTPPVLNKSLGSCDPGAASTSNHLLPASTVVGFSVPASPSPFRVPPLHNAESLTLLSNTTPFSSTGNATLPRLRARGLVNTENMCFANAVLRLLAHCPPFWDLFGELGDLKRPQRAGVPETGDVATPLVDATLRFFEEFRFTEKGQTPPQEPLQLIAGGKMSEDEETKKDFDAVDSFKPIYMYDAMKEKRQLKNLLVRSCATYRPAVTDPRWPNVYRKVNSKTRKSFSLSTLTHSMKNCSRYSLLRMVTSRLLHPEQKSARCLSQARLT
jgi:hypothetical protein